MDDWEICCCLMRERDDLRGDKMIQQAHGTRVRTTKNSPLSSIVYRILSVLFANKQNEKKNQKRCNIMISSIIFRA